MLTGRSHFDSYGNMKVDDEQAVIALAALAQESRLQVFRLLVRHGEDGLPAGEIAEALGLPPATLSFHLSQLAQSRLVDSRRNGRSISYFIRVEGIRALMAYLTKDCCGGRSELCLPVADLASCCVLAPPARKKRKRK